MRKLTTRGAVLLAVGVLIAACGGGASEDPGVSTTADSAISTSVADSSETTEESSNPPEELRQIKLGTSLTQLDPVIAGWTMPMALGFWEEEGLEVELLGFPGGAAVLQAIDAGQIDAGGSGSGPLLAAVEQGTDLISYYTSITRSSYIPQVLPDSPIESPEDFAGTTIGVSSLESAAVPIVQAILNDAGVDPESVDIVGVGIGAEAAESLVQGRVDAITLWDAGHLGVENVLGMELRSVVTDKFDNVGFQELLVVPSSALDDRDLLVGLARGVAKGHVFAHENPEAAVRLHWELYPETKPTGVPEAEALADAVGALEARNANTTATDGVWGLSTPESISTIIEALTEAGVIEGNVEASQVYTPDLLDEINDFDVEEIRRLAREYE